MPTASDCATIRPFDSNSIGSDELPRYQRGAPWPVRRVRCMTVVRVACTSRAVKSSRWPRKRAVNLATTNAMRPLSIHPLEAELRSATRCGTGSGGEPSAAGPPRTLVPASRAEYRVTSFVSWSVDLRVEKNLRSVSVLRILYEQQPPLTRPAPPHSDRIMCVPTHSTLDSTGHCCHQCCLAATDKGLHNPNELNGSVTQRAPLPISCIAVPCITVNAHYAPLH